MSSFNTTGQTEKAHIINQLGKEKSNNLLRTRSKEGVPRLEVWDEEYSMIMSLEKPSGECALALSCQFSISRGLIAS